MSYTYLAFQVAQRVKSLPAMQETRFQSLGWEDPLEKLREFGGFVCFLFWPPNAACCILVPRSGIKPVPSAVEAQSPNHWIAKEFFLLL